MGFDLYMQVIYFPYSMSYWLQNKWIQKAKF